LETIRISSFCLLPFTFYLQRKGVIKTVPFDIPASFLIGMLVPIVCANRIGEASSAVKNQYFLGLVLFELFFFLPLGAYLYFFYPDWSLMYFVDPANFSEAVKGYIGGGALACYLLAAVAGFVTAAQLVRTDRRRTALLVFGGVALAMGVFCAFTIRQLGQVGDYAAWNALPRTTVALYRHRLGYIVGIDATAATAVLGLMLRSFVRGG
jgi:hypothetical protein